MKIKEFTHQKNAVVLIKYVEENRKNGKCYLFFDELQVLDEKAYKREFGAFTNIDNLSQKIIITNDDIDYSTSSVRYIKLKDFLLMEEL